MDNTKLWFQWIIIVCLLLIGCCVILQIYYRIKKEHFFFNPPCPPTVPCQTVTQSPVYNSIISSYSGVGINIVKVSQGTSVQSSQPLYTIQRIPVTQNATLGGVYAITSDNLLTISVENINDASQFWTLTPITKSTEVAVMPFIQNAENVKYALQYENGSLALRVYNPSFQSQLWIPSTSVFDKGIPILNFNGNSMYTPEFNPYGSIGKISSNSLDSQNTKQVDDVINLIKQGMSQYMAQLNASSAGTQNVSASSFGNQSNPLNINVSLSGESSQSNFADVSSEPQASDVITLLNKYEASADGPVDIGGSLLYRKSDLDAQLKSSMPITSVNIDDYVSNRIGSCNCKL